MPKNLAGGVRMNGAFTYLAPARTRANLTIAADTLVDRIEFDGERAVTAAYRRGRHHHWQGNRAERWRL